MKVYLFATEVPHGRCLLLARKLREATSVSGEDAIILAEKLFAWRHKANNPVAVEVPDGLAAEELRRFCENLGISVEKAPP
jgi:hypothetical protein